MKSFLAIAAVTLLTACAAATPAPVPVAGAGMDLAQLIGEWVGQYESVESGRSGSIRFMLGAVGDTAFGDVVMVPNTGATAPGSRPPFPPVTGEVLAIRFVGVAGNRVRGTLLPYRDPDCGCRVLTVFEGIVRGDVIRGTYLTVHTEHPREVHGNWLVRRLRPVT